MNSVEGRIRMALPLAGATSSITAPRGAGDGTTSAMPGAAPTAPPAGSAVPACPTGGLASLLDEARLAQAQLASQPLPITNHGSQLILKLLGG